MAVEAERRRRKPLTTEGEAHLARAVEISRAVEVMRLRLDALRADRRRVWMEANDAGVVQRDIAEACEKPENDVAREIGRARREADEGTR